MTSAEAGGVDTAGFTEAAGSYQSDGAKYTGSAALASGEADWGSFAVDQARENDRQRASTAGSAKSASSAMFMETVGADDNGSESGASSGDPATVESGAAAPKKKGERIYYLDWLRVLAIYLVVCYHCVQALDWIALWTGIERQHVIGYKCSSLQVGMPIFFHISGRAQALTGKPKRVRNTIIVRFQRLIIPAVVGYFLLIPFWQYVWLREERGCHSTDGLPAAASLDSQRLSQDTYPPGCPQWYIPWLFWFFQPGHYEFNVGWLWFLPTLFFIGVVSAPLFLFAEEPAYRVKYGIVGSIMVAVLLGLLCVAGCPLMMVLMSGLGIFSLGAIVLIVPFPPKNEVSWSEMRWLAVQGSTLITILTQIGLVCSFRYPDLGEALKMVPALLLFFSFYTHGYFIQRWAVGRAEAEAQHTDLDASFRPGRVREFMGKLKLWTGVWQIITVGMMVLSIAVGAPVGEWERELFPIYSASYKGSWFFAAAHICGAWAQVGLVVAWFQAYANKEFHPVVYKHATSSVIVIYIFHFVFIAPFAFWVVRDCGMLTGFWKLMDPVLTLLVGCAGPYGIYTLLLRYPKASMLFGL